MHEIILKQEIFDEITKTCLDTFAEGKMIPVDEMQKKLMDIPGVPIHYPYHHYIQPAAFLTLAAIADSVTQDQLKDWLASAEKKGKSVPGGFCGNCGSCGAAVGIGIFLSTYTGTIPVSKENWAMVNEGTGRALMKIATFPGPRCCKRTLFLAAQEGVAYAKEKLNLPLTINKEIKCHYYHKNPDCLEHECPFYQEG